MTGWVEAVGWALVRSTWQASGVALALALTLRVLRRGPPQARYLAGLSALALMVALPLGTGGPGSRPIGAIPGRVDRPVGVASAPEALATVLVRAEPADRVRSALPWVVGAWALGVGLLAVRLAGGLAVAGRRCRRAVGPIPAPWVGRVDRIKAGLGLSRAVRLLESGVLEVPTVIGWIRPTVLVPASAWLGLSTAELEAILAHELAHVRRHDYLVNLLQCGLETLLFFHPAARWASAVIRQEREHCCDDLAVAVTGDRLTYARALAAMEGLRGPGLSPSLAANGGTLLARVARILDPRTQEDGLMRPSMTLGALALALALGPIGLARVAAQQPATPPPSAPHAGPGESVPGKIYADIITGVDEDPAGRLIFGAGATAPGGLIVPSLRFDGRTNPQARAFDLAFPVSRLMDVDGDGDADLVIAQGPREAPGPKPPEAERVRGLDPPTDAEACAKAFGDRDGTAMARRPDVKVTVVQVGSEVDPPRVFPLAGLAQLVHIHYKATIEYLENGPNDGPPVTRMLVVAIDKDHLRQARKPTPAGTDGPGAGGPPRSKPQGEPMAGRVDQSRVIMEDLEAMIRDRPKVPAPADAGAELDRKLEELAGRVEALKRQRQGAREARQEELELLNRELDELERRTQADPKKGAGLAPARPGTLSLPIGPKAFTFAVGAFW